VFCGRGWRPRVEWLRYSDWTGARPVPLPSALAHLKREISEKKWAESRRWEKGTVSRKKYKLPAKKRPDGTAVGSFKWLASRLYQLKPGHCLTGRYLNWTKSRPTAQCWRCPYRTQTREHFFKVWKAQQEILGQRF